MEQINLTNTLAGLKAIQRCMAGEDILFTKLEIGDGVLTTPDISGMTGLINKTKEYPLGAVQAEESEVIRLRSNISNKDVAEALIIREYGIYAKFREEQEFLFAYLNVGESTTPLPSQRIGKYELNRDFVLYIGNSLHVDFTSNGHLVYVAVNEYKDDMNRKANVVGTIEDLKNSKKYKVGDVVQVLGYHTPGDGGGHLRQKTVEEYVEKDRVIANDGSVWKIAHNNVLRPSWFGFRDMDNIDHILEFASKTSCKLILENGNHVFTKLDLTSNTNIDGNLDSSFLLYKGTNTNAIMRKDDNSNVIGAQLKNITITTAKNGSGGILAQDNNRDKFGLNLFGCAYTVLENVSISGFGLGAVKFGRCESGAENEGFINTTKDGNYNTFINVRFSSCGKYGIGAIDFKYKANSNNLYSIYMKGGINKAVVFTYGGNNSVFGGTIESVTDCVTFEDLAQRNNCYGIRMEGFTNGYITKGETKNSPNTVINPYFSTGTNSYLLNKPLLIIGDKNSTLNINTYPTENLSRDLPNILTTLNYLTSSEDDTINITQERFGIGTPKVRFIDSKTNPTTNDQLATRLFKTLDSSNIGSRDTYKESIIYIDALGNVASTEEFFQDINGKIVKYSDYRGLTFIPLKSTLIDKPINGVYWNSTFEKFELFENEIAITDKIVYLDTPFYVEKMKEEGVYEDFKKYMNDRINYNNYLKDQEKNIQIG